MNTPETIYAYLTTGWPEGVVYRKDAYPVPVPIKDMREHPKSCELALYFDIGPRSKAPPWSPAVHVFVHASGTFRFEFYGTVSEKNLALYLDFLQGMSDRLKTLGAIRLRLT